MTRTGKIARLPHALREQLNLQIQNGEHGIKQVEWLNSLPEVQRVLHEHFSGRPITEQNLSEWKQGGYKEWLQLQQAREMLELMREEGADLEAVADFEIPSRWLSATLAFALGRSLQAATDAGFDTPAKRREIMKIAREISRLRGRDHQAARARLQQECWDAKHAQETKASPDPNANAAPADRSQPAHKSHSVPSVLLVPPHPASAEAPTPTQTEAPAARLNQSKSNQIRPNPSASALKPTVPTTGARAPISTQTPAGSSELISPIGPIRPIRTIPNPSQTEPTLATADLTVNPTKSNQIQPNPTSLRPRIPPLPPKSRLTANAAYLSSTPLGPNLRLAPQLRASSVSSMCS